MVEKTRKQFKNPSKSQLQRVVVFHQQSIQNTKISLKITLLGRMLASLDLNGGI
jgi:hypothetical protein